MKVVSKNRPIIINRNVVRGTMPYSSFDASSVSQIKMFQDWMDSIHPNWVNGKNLNKGAGYGKYGPSTSAANSKYGAEFDNYIQSISQPPVAPDGKPTNPLPKTAAQKKKENADKIWDVTKKVYTKGKEAQELGMLDKLKDTLGMGDKGGNPAVSNSNTNTNDPSAKEPWSTTKKIVVGVSIAAGLTAVVLIIKRLKKKK